MQTQYTISDVLKKIVVDIDNMNSFLFSLQNILESKSENVSVDQTNEDGSTFTINVPSFGYLKGKIEDINSRFDTLLSANDDVIGIKSSNGDVRKFELKKTSQLIKDLESVQNASFNTPTEFKVKNNWFFESFLNPLLYVSLDISAVLTDDIDQFSVKRVIVNAVNNDTASSFFDTNYKGKNNVSLSSLKLDLENNAIDYFEDDNIVDVETAINRFKGAFDVIRILEEESAQQLTGQSVSIVRRRYKLNSLNYTDVLSGVQNSKILAEGDVLITSNDSEYVVRSVNKTDLEVVLERVFGIEPITIGAAILSLKPQPYRAPELQINVGFNEREIIFIKPISKSKNLTIDEYSTGVSIFTNDLTIPLPDNSTTTLANYYSNFVSDFGLILLNMAKERKTPAIIAVTPTAPIVDAANFSVVQVDQHIQDDQNIKSLTTSIKEKATLEKEIQELNKQIESIKANITTTAKTEQEAKRLQKQLKESQTLRDEKTTTLSTLVTNITLKLSTTPQFLSGKRYSVRGFWQIPSPIKTVYGTQYIVQFKYRYRYLSQTGTQPSAKQQTFVDTDGTTKSATFSPWIEKLTKPRKKELDNSTGLYKWMDENLSDADAVNSNQLDISLRKGETVEIQIASISEAGWPDNPVESDWSLPVQVPFPEDIVSEEEATIISQKAFSDKVRLDFEKELVSRGVDTHLANQFTTGDRFFAHKAQDISSGFFTSSGNVIDLFEQITSLKNSLEAVQQALAVDRGVIKVNIIDPDGNTTSVTNGSTISLFAGYYKDLIKDTTGGTTVYNEGKVITKQYILSIQNTSANPLELISLLFGGMSQIATSSSPSGNPDNDYHVNRRYDIVPISINKNQAPAFNDFKQIPSQQSGQVKSQFINCRVRNYGLSEELYQSTGTVFNPTYSLNSNYGTTSPTAYRGTAYGTSTIPYNWGHYLPYDPAYAVSGAITSTKVWNGQNGITNNPLGGGYLTEFCISKDHPDLLGYGANFNSSYNVSKIIDAFRPKFDGPSFTSVDLTKTQKTLPFSHALHFETSVADNKNLFGVEYYKQASRVTPTLPDVLNANRTDAMYPIKLGFTKKDEYLIGKYTCGAYLYMYPLTYDAISVEGNFPERSTKSIKTGSENAVNIPILFQFRCSDTLGYIGGYRIGSTLTNVKYQKKIGIDIILKSDSPFSFDLEISSQYNKETSLDAPLVQGTGTTTKF